MRYGHLIAIFLLLACAAVFGILVLAAPAKQRIGVSPRPQNPPGATTSAGMFYTEPQSSNIANVMYMDDGFHPLTLSVPAGTTVVFQNRSRDSFWPESTPAAGSDYPQPGLCGGTAFNACMEAPPNATWSFKFDRIGQWSYRDKLHPERTGLIIVN